MDLIFTVLRFYGIKQRTDICCNLFLRTLVFQLAAVLLLPLLLGINGIWSAVAVAELLTLGLTVTFFVRNRKNIIMPDPFFAKSDYQFVYLRPALPQMLIQQMSAFPETFCQFRMFLCNPVMYFLPVFFQPFASVSHLSRKY